MRTRIVALGSAAAVVAGAVSALGAPTAYPRPGRTELVTVGANGVSASYLVPRCDGAPWGTADVSADGRFVAYATAATNLVAGSKPSGGCDVYWRDLQRGVTKRVNVGVGGIPAVEGVGDDPGPGPVAPSISADGRYVAFYSRNRNLVPGDTNNAGDVFVADMQSGSTTRVSVGSDGTQGNGGSGQPALSADGRYVAFSSFASNLVKGDSNGAADVFVRDLRARKTVRVSVASGGAQGNAPSWAGVTISANGRYVAFGSFASNLVPGDTTNQACQCAATNVFWHDMRTGKTVRVSVASDGAQASFASIPSCVIGTPPTINAPDPIGPVGGLQVEICASSVNSYGGRHISDDGRYVTFYSNASNLVPNDTNNAYDIFVHDVATGRTERISVNSFGQEFPEGAVYGAISGDGRSIAFNPRVRGKCSGTLPVVLSASPFCTPNTASVYDRASGAVDRLGRSWKGGEPTQGHCDITQIAETLTPGAAPTVTAFGLSRDGRYAVIGSNASDLVPNDTNDRCDYFVRDRGAGLGGQVLTGVQPPAPAPAGFCVVEGVCVPPVAPADLSGARAVHRTGTKDVYLRWDLRGMSPTMGAPVGGLLYGMEFSAGGSRYQVRAQRIAGPDFDLAGGASFGLFRESLPGVWMHVASLKGGYGTIGDSVVTAVALSLLGGTAQLTDVSAYTALGSYLSGPTKVLDSLRLSR